MKIQGQIAVILTVVLCVHDVVSMVLDDYIRNYEHVDYSSTELHERHLRHRRSMKSPVHVDINAFNRHFKLVLRQDSSMFSKDLTLEFKGSERKPDTSFIYSGQVEGIPGSRVHGAIIEGIFRGWFTLPGEKETYHVEKSRRFFDNPVFHSIIYKESDMELDPYKERRQREKREAKDAGSCGYEKSREWMQDIVRSEYIAPNRAKRSEMKWQEVNKGSYNKYSARVNTEEDHLRNKRQTKNLGINNTCFMSLTSDPMFWDHYLLKANNNEDVARDEILAFFSSHIIAINNIYGRTTFSTEKGDLSYSGVQFRVQKTKVMTPASDCPRSSFCEGNIDVSNFLNLNSQTNHDLFCLAYVFTYRDFSFGTLGLAWVGAPSAAAGGLCETYKTYKENEKRVSKSLNTGIVTVLNYGKEVPTKVSQLTFAHEVGHNFGSPHDAGTECAPYGSGRSDASEGNYIMFASATMGDRPHNSQFSVCSRDNISRVLDAVINYRFGKINCFKASEASFCGNGLVEDGEECDCGFKADCTDTCCNPKDPDSTDTAQECKLKQNAKCSPTQGPCCSDQCDYIKVDTNKTCRFQEDCVSAAYCDGSSPACPDSVLAPNGTYCNNYGLTCQQGECDGSLCEQFGWVECFLTTTEKATSKEQQEELCKLGCRQNDSTECILSNDKVALAKYPDYHAMIDDVFEGRQSTERENGVQLAPGSPCNNFQGYCDVFYRCRGVDAEGPLSRLNNFIFNSGVDADRPLSRDNPETLDDGTNWIVEYWWAVLLISIGLILFMGVFIIFFMTLRRRRNQNRKNPSSQAPPQPQQVRYPQHQQERGYKEIDYPYMTPQGPPPSYPGSSSASSHMGPPHGHGKGKGRHKSKDMKMGRI